MHVYDRAKALQEEIAMIAARCGRSFSEIELIAVTKNYSLEHILPAYEAGITNFGENRLQEAFDKMELAPKEISWHLIGTLQTKKVSKVKESFALIHSVDSIKLAEKLSQTSVEQAILLQVNSSGEATKQGFSPAELQESYEKLSLLPNLKIQGFMTMAPLTDDKKVIRRCFSLLRHLRDELDSTLPHLSMGMSNDYAIAIEEGATLLRIGSALFR